MLKAKAERLERALRRIFWENVRNFRKELGLSQYDLADMADISQSYLGRAERNSGNITLDRVARIADCLGKSPAELLS